MVQHENTPCPEHSPSDCHAHLADVPGDRPSHASSSSANQNTTATAPAPDQTDAPNLAQNTTPSQPHRQLAENARHLWLRRAIPLLAFVLGFGFIVFAFFYTLLGSPSSYPSRYSPTGQVFFDSHGANTESEELIEVINVFATPALFRGDIVDARLNENQLYMTLRVYCEKSIPQQPDAELPCGLRREHVVMRDVLGGLNPAVSVTTKHALSQTEHTPLLLDNPDDYTGPYTLTAMFAFRGVYPSCVMLFSPDEINTDVNPEQRLCDLFY